MREPDLQKSLTYWHRLEHFSPAPVPKGKTVSALPKDVPWYIPLRPKNINRAFEYTLYLGVFSSRASDAFVESFFGGQPEHPNARHQLLCRASLKVNQRGHYLQGSFGLSTFPWALGQLQRGRLNRSGWAGAFTGVKDALEDYLRHHFKETIRNRAGEVERISTAVTLAQLQALERAIIKACGWEAPEDARRGIIVDRQERPRPSGEAGTEHTADILSSFYLQDLERIMDRHGNTDYPPALRRYLSASLNLAAGERTDVLERVDQLRASLSPQQYPNGCWPSPYSLNLMQQFAVNTTLDRLGGGQLRGLSSVNGPPGTGKTTLLRDVIAAILVRRATTMVEISDPTRAFKQVGKLSLGSFNAAIYTPTTILRDAGIVVASTNNGAVENISRELPLKTAIAPEFEDDIAYFRGVAEQTYDKDYWGLISVVLGNRRNCRDVVNRLWFSKGATNLRTTLNEGKLLNLDAWRAARQDFTTLLGRVTAEKKRLTGFQRDCETLREAVVAEQRLARANEAARRLHHRLRADAESATEATGAAEAEQQSAIAELNAVRTNKPGFFAYWLDAAKRRSYETAKERALSRYNEATATYQASTARRAEVE